jgi:hypothetical protein
MLDFMEKNYTTPGKLFYGDDEQTNSNFTDDMSYDHVKTGLGFDYGPIDDMERQYIYCVLRWVALKIGRKKHFKKYGTMPHYIYDGCEAMLISVGRNLDGWTAVDSLGCNGIEDKYLHHTKRNGWKRTKKEIIGNIEAICDKKVSEINSLIRNEIKRLDKLWEKA